MALVNKAFSVNVTPGMMPPIVHVSEYDVGRAYTVGILDEQGNIFTIPTGTTASIEGTLNGSVGFTQSATVSNNQVSFTLSQDMTAYSGKAWCKIKLTQNSQPIQTCAFILAVDRAGVEADTILHSPGFQEQINEGIAEYFDNDPPFFELPEGGQSGQALISDGAGGAVWGQAQGGGGLTEDVKQALLDCFENVAWLNDQWQTYYDALEAALYPPSNLVSISAVFAQGQNKIYTNNTLSDLKQYLTVTAHYDDSTAEIVTDYTLSGSLAEAGTRTVMVFYKGKQTTFTVIVTQYTENLAFVIGGSDPTTDVRNTNNARRQSDVPVPLNNNGQAFDVSANIIANGSNTKFIMRFYDANGNYVGYYDNTDSDPRTDANNPWMSADGTVYNIKSVSMMESKLQQSAKARFVICGVPTDSDISSFSGTITVGGVTYNITE